MITQSKYAGIIDSDLSIDGKKGKDNNRSITFNIPKERVKISTENCTLPITLNSGSDVTDDIFNHMNAAISYAKLSEGNNYYHAADHRTVYAQNTGEKIAAGSFSDVALYHGRYYFEFEIVKVNGTANDTFGIVPFLSDFTHYPGQNVGEYGYRTTDGTVRSDGSVLVTYDTAHEGDVIGVAVDLINRKLYFAINNIWQNNSDPSKGKNAAASGIIGPFVPAVSVYNDNDVITLNSSPNSFKYVPPEGYEQGCYEITTKYNLAYTDNNEINSLVWGTYSSFGENICKITDDNKIKLSIADLGASTPNSTSIKSKFILRDNFDFQIDFNVVEVTNVNNAYVSLRLFPVTGGEIRLDRVFGTSGNYVFADNRSGWNQKGSASTSDITGKFRFKRTRSVLTAYYWDGTSWIQMGGSISIDDDVYVLASVFNYASRPDIIAEISNPILNHGRAIFDIHPYSTDLAIELIKCKIFEQIQGDNFEGDSINSKLWTNDDACIHNELICTTTHETKYRVKGDIDIQIYWDKTNGNWGTGDSFYFRLVGDTSSFKIYREYNNQRITGSDGTIYNYSTYDWDYGYFRINKIGTTIQLQFKQQVNDNWITRSTFSSNDSDFKIILSVAGTCTPYFSKFIINKGITHWEKGSDPIFKDHPSVSKLMPIKLDNWKANNNHIKLWVNIPFISTWHDTKFKLYYDIKSNVFNDKSVFLLKAANAFDGDHNFIDYTSNFKISKIGNPIFSSNENNEYPVSIKINGQSDYLIIDDFNISGRISFIVSLWIKRTRINTREYIFGQGNVNSDISSESISLYIDENNYLHLLLSDGTNELKCSSVITGYQINDNDWHYINIERKGNFAHIYLDNIEISRLNIATFNINTSTDSFAIGRHGDNDNYPFVGYIDEFSVHKYNFKSTNELLIDDDNTNEESLNTAKIINLYIPKQTEKLYDFPILLNLSKKETTYNVSDDFIDENGSFPNSILWKNGAYGYDKKQIQNNRLKISIGASDITNSYVTSNYTISGDFDIESRVSITGPNQNNWYLHLMAVSDDDTQKWSAAMLGFYSGTLNIGLRYDDNGSNDGDESIVTTATDSYIRLLRTNDTVTAYYKDEDGNWIQIGNTKSWVSDNIRIRLNIYKNITTSDLTGYFDSFKVNKGRIIWDDHVNRGAGLNGFDCDDIFNTLHEKTTFINADIYVAKYGSDSNDGLLSSPFATIAHAVSQASAGDVLAILPGEYTETASIALNKDITITSSTGYYKDVIINTANIYRDAIQATGAGVFKIKHITIHAHDTGGGIYPSTIFGNNRSDVQLWLIGIFFNYKAADPEHIAVYEWNTSNVFVYNCIFKNLKYSTFWTNGTGSSNIKNIITNKGLGQNYSSGGHNCFPSGSGNDIDYSTYGDTGIFKSADSAELSDTSPCKKTGVSIENITTDDGYFNDMGCDDFMYDNPEKIKIFKDGVQCYCEIENWDFKNKQAQLWVKLSELDNAQFYLSYDNEFENIEDHSYILLIHSLNKNGSSDFYDYSDDHNSIITTGNVVHSDVQNKTSDTSIYFPGVSDYLSVPASICAKMASGPFTIDCWVYLEEYQVTNKHWGAPIFSQSNNSSNGEQILFISTNKKLVFNRSSSFSSTASVVSVDDIQLHEWVHIALVGDGSTYKLFINGKLSASVATTQYWINANTTPYIGRVLVPIYSQYEGELHGYISEFKISNRALWDSDFVPSEKLTDIFYTTRTGHISTALVWTKYDRVYHLSQDPSTGGACILDSTNQYDGTPSGLSTTDLIEKTNGKFIHFDGSAQYVYIGPSGTLIGNKSGLTVEAIISDYVSNTIGAIISDGIHWPDNISIHQSIDQTNDKYSFSLYDAGQGDHTNVSINSIPDETIYVASTFKVNEYVTSYLNGLFNSNTATDGNVIKNTTNSLLIGATNYPHYGTKSLRELRISTDKKSADWLRLSAYSTLDMLVYYSSENALSSNHRYEVIITIDEQNENAFDIPILIYLSRKSGTNDYDFSDLFNILGNDWHKIYIQHLNTKTQCYIEVEYWSNDTALLWVKIPELYSDKKTKLLLQYDPTMKNSIFVGDVQSIAGQNVWDNFYEAVYHLSQDPSTGGACILDSTIHRHNGTPNGMSTSDIINTPIGKGIYFHNNYINVPDHVDLRFSEKMTAEAHIYRLQTNWGAVFSKGYDKCYEFKGRDSMSWRIDLSDHTDVSISLASTREVWQHLAGTFNTGTQIAYNNGIQVTSVINNLNLATVSDSLKLGQDSGNQYFYGYGRDIWFSSVDRSQNWLSIMSNSKNDNLLSFEHKHINWDENKKVQITIPAQNEELINFPLLLNISKDSGINDFDCSFIIDELSSNKYKLAVIHADTDEQCYVEIESWDSENSKARLWIRVPCISAINPTIFYIYYDKNEQDNLKYVGEIGSYPAQKVWDKNYLLVYHMSNLATPSFTTGPIYTSEISGSSTSVASANTAFTNVDRTGLSKNNGALSIWLKVSNVNHCNWDNGAGSDIEITSSGTHGNQEWKYSFTRDAYNIRDQISTEYKQFIIPLIYFDSSDGGLDVSSINYIRWFCQCASSNTALSIYWKNAEIIPWCAIQDSTINKRHALHENMDANNLVTSIFNKSLAFNGSDEWIKTAQTIKTENTFEITFLPTKEKSTLFSVYDSSDINRWDFHILDTAQIYFYIDDISYDSTTYINRDEWTDIAFTTNSTNFKFFHNGQIDGIHTTTKDLTSTRYLSISARPDGTSSISNTYHFGGEINEFRLSNSVRSDIWLSTTYKSNRDELISLKRILIKKDNISIIPTRENIISGIVNNIWDDNIVACYHLNDLDFKDQTGESNNDLTIIGTINQLAGKYKNDNAVIFDGISSYLKSDTFTYNMSTFTFIGVMTPYFVSSSKMTFLHKGDATMSNQQGIALSIKDDNSLDIYWFYNNWRSAQSINKFKLNEPNIICISINNTTNTATLVLNDNIEEIALSSVIPMSTYHFLLGCYKSSGYTWFFNGDMQHIEIYSDIKSLDWMLHKRDTLKRKFITYINSVRSAKLVNWNNDNVINYIIPKSKIIENERSIPVCIYLDNDTCDMISVLSNIMSGETLFNDDFVGNVIDTSKWTSVVSGPGYTSQNNKAICGANSGMHSGAWFTTANTVDSKAHKLKFSFSVDIGEFNYTPVPGTRFYINPPVYDRWSYYARPQQGLCISLGEYTLSTLTIAYSANNDGAISQTLGTKSYTFIVGQNYNIEFYLDFKTGECELFIDGIQEIKSVLSATYLEDIQIFNVNLGAGGYDDVTESRFYNFNIFDICAFNHNSIAIQYTGTKIPISYVDEYFRGRDYSLPDNSQLIYTLYDNDISDVFNIRNNKLKVQLHGVTGKTTRARIALDGKIKGDFSIELHGKIIGNSGANTIGFYVISSDAYYIMSRDVEYQNHDQYRLNCYNLTWTSNCATSTKSYTAKDFHIRFTRNNDILTVYVWENDRWEWNNDINGYTFSRALSSDCVDIMIDSVRQENVNAGYLDIEITNIKIDGEKILWNNPENVLINHPHDKTTLPILIESFDIYNNKGKIWTRIPYLSKYSDTLLSLYFDNTKDRKNRKIGDDGQSIMFSDTSTQTGSGWIGYTNRVLINTSGLSDFDNHIQVIFLRHTVDWEIINCHIGYQSNEPGDEPYDFEKNSVKRVLMNDKSSFTITENKQLSDPIEFFIDKNKNIILSFDIGSDSCPVDISYVGQEWYKEAFESGIENVAGYVGANQVNGVIGIQTAKIWDSNFVSVQLLTEKNSLIDCTGNLLSATEQGTVNYNEKGVTFSDVDSWIDLAKQRPIPQNSKFSINTFFNTTDTGTDQAIWSESYHVESSNTFGTAIILNDSTISFQRGTNNTVDQNIIINKDMSDGNWYYFALSYDSNSTDNTTVFVDGSSTVGTLKNDPISYYSISAYDGNTTIGNIWYDGTTKLYHFNGTVSFIMISNIVRSDAWNRILMSAAKNDLFDVRLP